MDEFERIKTFFAPLAGPQGLGLTDDAALLAAPEGETLVFTKDMLVEGVHVPRGGAPAVFAQRAMRTNLSDIAAMGAEPLGYLLGLGLPDQVEDDWVSAFSSALAHDQKAFGLTLWGGDTVRTSDAVTISITMIGSAPEGLVLHRSGADAGDDIYVSGHIGRAGAGLQMALGNVPGGRDEWMKAYTMPEPRIGLGIALRGLATACADVSDGLIADTAHIAYASGLRARLTLSNIPTDSDLPLDRMAAASAGDDYELVFTAAAEDRAAIFTVSETIGVKVARIGSMASPSQGGDQPGIDVLDAHGVPLKIDRSGWRHRQ